MKPKLPFLLMIALLSASSTSGQSAYQGGEGDGYAQASLEFGQTSLRGADVFPSLRIYPNPARYEEVIFLEGIPAAEGQTRIEVVTISGQVVHRQTLQPGQTEVSFQTALWPMGSMLIRVIQENKMGVFRVLMIDNIDAE